jgi:hypothetical protein
MQASLRCSFIERKYIQLHCCKAISHAVKLNFNFWGATGVCMHHFSHVVVDANSYFVFDV